MAYSKYTKQAFRCLQKGQNTYGEPFTLNPWKENWKTRPTYIPHQIVKDFPFFIIKTVGSEQGLEKVHERDFSIISVLKLMDCMVKEEVQYSKLFYLSGFRHKKSFDNYMNFCKHFKLIEGRKHEEVHQQMIFYKATAKGRNFIDLFKEVI
jgi:hypothetical protein